MDILEISECIKNSHLISPIPVEYQEPNEYEKKMLEGTKTAEEILNEENKEKQARMLEVVATGERERRREIVTRWKIVALDRIGKHPLTDPKYLSQREKTKLIHIMTSLQDIPEEEVIKEFNEICNDILFTGKSDPSTFPVYRY